jgi:hypothetical protein
VTAPRRRGRAPLAGLVLAAVAAVAFLWYLWPSTDPAEGAARNYLKALAAGDADLACTLVTPPFGQEIAARHGVSECPDGVDAMLAGLSDRQRDELGDARLTTTGDHGSLEVGANPLGLTVLRVDKVGEEWMVTGDR